jgi:hypothetical protein
MTSTADRQFIYLFIFGYLYSANPRVSYKRFTFTHITGCATWVTLESRLHNSGAHDLARFLSSLDLNPPSELPIIKDHQTYQDFV